MDRLSTNNRNPLFVPQREELIFVSHVLTRCRPLQVLHNVALVEAELGNWEKAQENLVKALDLRTDVKLSLIDRALESTLVSRCEPRWDDVLWPFSALRYCLAAGVTLPVAVRLLATEALQDRGVPHQNTVQAKQALRGRAGEERLPGKSKGSPSHPYSFTFFHHRVNDFRNSTLGKLIILIINTVKSEDNIN